MKLYLKPTALRSPIFFFMRKLELLEKLSPDQNHVFHPQNWNLSEHYIKLSRSLSLVVSSGDDAISTDPTFHFKLLFFFVPV